MSINGPLKISQLPVVTSSNGTEKFPAINTSVDGTFQNILIPASVLGNFFQIPISALSDVSVSSPTNGQVLTYNSSAGEWQNQSTGAVTLSALSDVSISSPSNGQVLTYSTSDSKWHNTTLTSGSLVKLGTGSIDTSVSSGLLDLRSIVTNDTYKKLEIHISNIISTGSSGTSFMSIAFAQQGTVNTSSNYASTFTSGALFSTGNFNQSPNTTTRLFASMSSDASDGAGKLDLYNFCLTSRKPPRVSLDMVAYTANGTITSEIASFGLGLIAGSGGDDSKITDGLSFRVNGATKFTFDYEVYGVIA